MSQKTENAVAIQRYYKKKTAAGDKRASVWISKETSEQIDTLLGELKLKSRDELIASLISKAADGMAARRCQKCVGMGYVSWTLNPEGVEDCTTCGGTGMVAK